MLADSVEVTVVVVRHATVALTGCGSISKTEKRCVVFGAVVLRIPPALFHLAFLGLVLIISPVECQFCLSIYITIRCFISTAKKIPKFAAGGKTEFNMVTNIHHILSARPSGSS
jgi:hypothetical protein